MSPPCRTHASLRARQNAPAHRAKHPQLLAACVLGACLFLFGTTARAVILWSDLGATLVNNAADGPDILGKAVARDDSISDVLYFKFHVDPMSDVGTEEYSAGFQLFEAGQERLGIGNSLKAWAYSAFNTASSGEFNKVFGDIDLASSRPESPGPGVFLPYELPRRGIEITIIFKVQYIPNDDDSVTVWLNPDLAPGATEQGQPENLVTRFKADASFDSIRLRHQGGGAGWTFSEMAIATAFADFVHGGEPFGDEAMPITGRDPLPFTFRTWQREQGLPQNSIRALGQTRDGYLWIGTDDGLTRFDGIRFVSFGPREGWRGGRVRVLFEDSSRRLWIGTAAEGLVCYAGGVFTFYSRTNGLPADNILALAEGPPVRQEISVTNVEPLLWIGTDDGLTVWQDFRPVLPELTAKFNHASVTTLHSDYRGGVWIGARKLGVFYYAEGKLTAIETDPALDPLLQDPHCILLDRTGRVWIGAGDDYVLCREDNQWRRYRIPRHLARPYVASLAEAPDGTVWAGSVSEGLFQFKAGKLTTVNAGTGLSDNTVQTLLADREGNLWVGTGAGLNRLRPKRLLVFGAREGLGYGAVAGLTEVAPGVLWAAKPGEGLFRWEGRSFKRLPHPSLSREFAQARVLLTGADGSCWVGGPSGLVRFETPAEADPQPKQIFEGQNVLSLAEKPDKGVWAGTAEGQLWEMDGGRWIARSNAFQPKPITAIMPEAGGALWFGTDGAGLFRLPPGRHGQPRKVSGLLSDSVRALQLDPAGTLWIGTAGGGLGRWHSNQLTVITTREGLPDNTISQIVDDAHGHLWLGTSRGIARVRKSEIFATTATNLPGICPLIFGRSDGMLSEECSGGFSPSGFRSANGWLWFPSSRGLVALDPRPALPPLPAPAVNLEMVLVDDTSAWPQAPLPGVQPQSQGPLQIGPGQRRIEFHYTGLSFAAPEQVRFRYKLEGLDPDWVEAGTRRTAFYGFLPPGQYRFVVTACNTEGLWNETAASLQLTILPHFWQTRWFLIVAGLGLLVSVGGATRLVEKRRLHRRLRHLESERALEKERARIAQDLHDDLGSSLTRISLLSDLVKADRDQPELLDSHAQKLSVSAAQTVRSLEEIVWALRPGSDSLQSLVQYIAHFATELFEGDSARCRLDLPHDLPARALPPEMRHNIFLIVKEALTNALKHASAKEVRVQAKATHHFLEIVVQDNGRGFASQEPIASGRHHNGLGNMRRRAEAIGGGLQVDTAPGLGTTVRLTVTFPPG